MYRQDALEHAYRCCEVNAGAPAVDGRTFEDIESYGRRRSLGELAKELRTKTYRPQAVPCAACSPQELPAGAGGQEKAGVPCQRLLEPFAVFADVRPEPQRLPQVAQFDEIIRRHLIDLEGGLLLFAAWRCHGEAFRSFGSRALRLLLAPSAISR